MAQSIKEFIDTHAGKVIGWGQCVAAFWRANLDTNKGEAYSAEGAADLWALDWDTYEKIGTRGGMYGDWGIWSGTSGAYINYDPVAGRGWGHVALFLRDNGDGTGQFMSLNPGPFQELTLSYSGLLGFLRGKGVARGLVVNRRVTWDKAQVRTQPRGNSPKHPDYPDGINQGENIAVVGYVKGEDPFPGGTLDDAWYVTKSGYYVWANMAENSLEGLVQL